MLSPLEYETAKGMHHALKPFKTATKIFEADSVLTIQRVITELFEIQDQLRKLSIEDGVVSGFAVLLQSSFDRRFPECGIRIMVYAVTHMVDPANKGCVLEVYPRAYEEARAKLLEMLKKFDKAPHSTTADNALTVSGDDEEDDSELSAVERLRKRRRVSGDQEES